MNVHLRPAIIMMLLGWSAPSMASPPGGSDPPAVLSTSRVGFAGGMGVDYFHAADIVDRVNRVANGKSSDFVAAAEFFGAVTFPLTKDWVGKVEYAYLIAGYNVPTVYPGSEFFVAIHLPTLVIQYILVENNLYNVKLGPGIGYHFGTYTEQYGTIDALFMGSGPGFKFDIEANTAFGDHLFGYLGADIRWDFIGTLSGEGSPPASVEPSLDFFGLGAKLGFTYYL